jgi:hypothetical protein
MITSALQDANLTYEKIKSFSDRLIAIENDLGYKEMRWLELSEMEA